jgi:hypothetical protein
MDTALPQPATPPRPFGRLLQNVRRWIPKSLVLAIVGIGLSSWLIPAITRQWDDRQRAGDLKAELVADMATATGRAVLDAQAFTYATADSRPPASANAAAVNEWSVAALEIRAKLDAYFGDDAVEAWEAVTHYVNSTLSRAYSRNFRDAFVPGPRPTTSPLGHLEDLYAKFYGGDYSVMNELATEILTQEERVARSILDMDVRGYSTTWDDVLSDLLPAV